MKGNRFDLILTWLIKHNAILWIMDNVPKETDLKSFFENCNDGRDIFTYFVDKIEYDVKIGGSTYARVDENYRDWYCSSYPFEKPRNKPINLKNAKEWLNEHFDGMVSFMDEFLKRYNTTFDEFFIQTEHPADTFAKVYFQLINDDEIDNYIDNNSEVWFFAWIYQLKKHYSKTNGV